MEVTVLNACGTVISYEATLVVLPRYAWYRDADGDGYGDSSAMLEAPDAPAGYVELTGDCDVACPFIHPLSRTTARTLKSTCSRIRPCPAR